jgi:hypothetical protein
MILYVFMLKLIGSIISNILSMFTVKVWFRLMVFNTTFNNISAISWRSVVLVGETEVPGENL